MVDRGSAKHLLSGPQIGGPSDFSGYTSHFTGPLPLQALVQRQTLLYLRVCFVASVFGRFWPLFSSLQAVRAPSPLGSSQSQITSWNVQWNFFDDQCQLLGDGDDEVPRCDPMERVALALKLQCTSGRLLIRCCPYLPIPLLVLCSTLPKSPDIAADASKTIPWSVSSCNVVSKLQKCIATTIPKSGLPVLRSNGTPTLEL